MRDSFGNALGGIRLAEHDVATAINSGENTGSGFCFLTGWHDDFDKTRLTVLYSTHIGVRVGRQGDDGQEPQGRLYREGRRRRRRSRWPNRSDIGKS